MSEDTSGARDAKGPAEPSDALREDAKTLLVGGATLGAFSIATTLLVGTTCPMCIVAAPVMLGAGAYKRWRATQAERAAAQSTGAAMFGAEPDPAPHDT